jgi:hypothetical protein
MKIRAKFKSFAIVAITGIVLSGCYAGGTGEVSPTITPKPGKQQGYIPAPAPTPTPEPTPVPEPTATPEPA